MSSATELLSGSKRSSELVIGLVCAVGTETRQVVGLLEERLGRAGYRAELIKISEDVIPQLVDVPSFGDDKFKRYMGLMNCGNDCRRLEGQSGSAKDGILALGAATVIATKRSLQGRDGTAVEVEGGKSEAGVIPFAKTAYIVDSLKRPEEVEVLRSIYGSGFVLVGIHEDIQRRQKHLIDDLGIGGEQATLLLERDQDERKDPDGQRVNSTFHLSDFFLRVTENREALRYEVQRMVELWFGNHFITPTMDEHFMFLAFAAALRSADLSRQVGAVIAREGELLATGANDCPAAGGGLYWPLPGPTNGERDGSGVGCAKDHPEGRDYTRGEDSNRCEQLRIIEAIIRDAKQKDPKFNDAVLKRVLDESSIRDLTEFGRVVHAEMEALLSCARCGTSVRGATLYCTTYPCHNCAKHIIAAGVGRVVYVEPYAKSKALVHHEEAIAQLGEAESPDGRLKVKFEPFVGVGPRRFFDVFSMKLGTTYDLVRKDGETGKRRNWEMSNADLRLQMNPASYVELESQATAMFGQQVAKKPIAAPPD